MRGKALDAAMKGAHAEIKALQVKTRGPTPTRDPLVEQRQRELRERLAALPKDRQTAILDEAAAHGDDHLVAAALNVPSWVAGMTGVEQEMLRVNWARRHHPQHLDRLKRIEKAIGDAQRAGQHSLGFVDTLTDAELIVEAEKSERRSADALKAAKAWRIRTRAQADGLGRTLVKVGSDEGSVTCSGVCAVDSTFSRRTRLNCQAP
jgi:hypothetical protein